MNIDTASGKVYSDRKCLLYRLADIPPAILLILVAILFTVLSLIQIRAESPTADEIIHLYAGYTYVVTKDYNVNAEHPPLAKLLAALPLLLGRVNIPAECDSYRFFYQCGNDPDFLLIAGRIPTILWGILLIVSVYCVSKDLYGQRGAFISLVLASVCPTLLAHSHLITTDASVTALIFLTLVSFWKFLRERTTRWAFYFGCMLGGALAAKFSSSMLMPILAWMGIVYCIRMRSKTSCVSQAGPLECSRRFRPWVPVATRLALSLLVSYVILWGVYAFRYSITSSKSDEKRLNCDTSKAGLTGRMVGYAARHQLLPQAYLRGFMMVQEHSSQGHPAYALGRYSNVGWWWYFPFAFLVKTPACALLMYSLGIYECIRRLRRLSFDDDFIIIPFVIYSVMAVMSNLNIGVRHIMPIYPLMMVLAGGIANITAGINVLAWMRRGVLLLLAGAMLESIFQAPYYLAYFNLPSRLFYERHQMLVDSNLDWGQDLGRLKKYMAANGIPRVKLAYFGHASPRHLGLDNSILPGTCSYPQYEGEWSRTNELLPNDYLAISATVYVGALVTNERDYYSRKLDRIKPVTRIGHSIFLYKMPTGTTK